MTVRRTDPMHEYQVSITNRILDQKRVNVWAFMGAGKSRATLTAISNLQLIDDTPTLIIAPYRVAQSTWPNEAETWDELKGLTVQPLLGTPEERSAALRIDAPVYSINDENIPWLVEQFAKRPWPFKTVIRDESYRFQGFRLKQGSIRAKALKKLAHTQIDRWVNLTGAPAPNGLTGLWGQNWFIDEGLRLGRTFDAFHQRWFRTFNETRPTANGKWTYKVPIIKPMDHAEREIHAALKDVCLAVDPRDYFDIAQPIVREVRVDLPPKARALYRDMEKKMFMELDGIGVEAFNAASKTMKCLQLAAGACWVSETEWRDVHDMKLQALESIITEAAGASVLVAYWFKPQLTMLQRAFPKARVLDKDPQTIIDWNAGHIPLMFIQGASAGHGVNLAQGGNILARMDLWWDFDIFAQVAERVGPIRQWQLNPANPKPSFVYPIIANDTIDELVMLRHETKRSTQDLLTSYMKEKRYA